MTLPLLAAVALALAWLLTLGLAQVRLVDAARETARAVARGESVPRAVAIGERVAPDGAVVDVQDGDPVVVRVTGEVRGPGGLLAFLPGARLEAEAVAAAEPGS
jgi:protein involved in polysaccharide export with SLBB domain